MRKKLIDELGINHLDSSLISLGSNFGVGRTTMLSIIAAEFYHEGKNVLFLTNELDEKTIMSRIKKALVGATPNLNLCSLNIKQYESDLENAIKSQFENQKYNVVIVDDLNPDYNLLRRLSFDNECLIMTTYQQRKNFNGENTIDYEIPNSTGVLQKSDVLYSLSIKKTFPFWENVKYFFCFWLKKPNRTLKILKNRYGKDGIKLDINIDFENLKIT